MTTQQYRSPTAWLGVVGRRLGVVREIMTTRGPEPRLGDSQSSSDS